MNTKILQLLELLVSHHGCVSFDRICEELDFTKRMLFYYQKKLNEYLKAAQLPETRISQGMLKIEYQDKQQFQKIFQLTNNNGYVLEPKERQDYILLNIGLGADSVTAEGLAEQLDISRSTVLSDIGDIKTYLDSYGISLQTKPRKGYFLTGDELNIRYVLMACGYNMKNPVMEKRKIDMLMAEASKRCGRQLDKGILNSLKALIYTSEKQIEKHFNYFSINDIAENLIFVYLRSFHANARLNESELQAHMEIHIARLIVEQMEELELHMAAAEIPYIQALLMGARIYTYDSPTIDIEVESFIKELFDAFERLSQIRLSMDTDTVLYQMFLLHLGPMFYRTKYRIKVPDFLDGTVRKMNSSFYYMARIAIDSCSSKYDLYVDDDEITYLSLYFSCIDNDALPSEVASMPHILIVCGFGLGCCVYIKSQLEKLLGDGYHYAVTDIRSLPKSITSQTALVVSTVDLQQQYNISGVLVITVSMVLTTRQKAELIQWMLQSNFPMDDSRVLGEVVDIISKSAEIVNPEKLVSDLRRYFRKESLIEEKEIRLEQIFRPEYVSICHSQVDWREAVYIAGMPLIEDNCIYPGYLEDIIRGIEEYGPYAECRKGILLAHAKPSAYTRRLALSVTLFKEPLYFEPWKKTMNMIFVLAVTNYKSHAAPLVELISNLSKADLPEALTVCEDAEALYHLLLEK